MVNRNIIIIFAVIGLFLMVGCGPKPVAPQAELDTPDHHVSNGNKLLKEGNIEDALREFNRAKDLDPDYSPAYVGIGLVRGKGGAFDKGIDSMKKAEGLAKTEQQKYVVDVGYMRLYTMGQESLSKKWVKQVEKYFKKAVKIDPQESAAYYYMGIAYKMNKNFDFAKLQLSNVLERGGEFAEDANKQFEIIQRIERALPGAKIAKIALLEKVTRADMAALFIEELKVVELFKSRVPKQFDASYKSPEKEFKTGEFVPVPKVTDIDDHVLKADIEGVMSVGIKGLQPYPDHTYQPDKFITRAEFAIMVEDILEKVTADKKISTRNFGGSSPFPDLRSDQYFFNAVMTCTTRGIMKAKEVSTGEFHPMGIVSGADALNSVRELKIQLEKY